MSITDKGKRYNSDLLEAVELGFLLDLAEVLVVGARARTESRGGHSREDYPNRDDANFMRHTMAYRRAGRLRSGWTTSRSSRPATSRWSASTDRDRDRCTRHSGTAAASPDGTITVTDPAVQPGARRRAALASPTTSPPQPTDRVLNLLHNIKWDIDGTLTFRRSCAHGVCGSDAMRINGANRLACKVLVKDLDLDDEVTIEPIKGLPLVKDLVVDMEPFFEAYRAVKPFLITSRQPADAGVRSSRRTTGNATTTPPNASCAPPAPPPARSTGPTARTSARRRS